MPKGTGLKRSARIVQQMEVESASQSEEEQPPESEEEATNDSEGSEEERGRRSRKKGRGRKSLQKKGDKRENFDKSAVGQSMDEMLANAVLYMLLKNNTKNIVKKSEIVKHCMSGQARNFPRLISKLETAFDEVFGIILLKADKINEAEPSTRPESFIIHSKFFMEFSDSLAIRSINVDAKRSILFIILALIYMTNKNVDEAKLWTELTTLMLPSLLNINKIEEFHRLIKTEYVNTGYLVEEVIDNDPVIYKYGWGIRAISEVNKVKILQFVCKLFPKNRPSDFISQFGNLSEVERKELLNEEARVEAEKEANDNSSGEDEDDGEVENISEDEDQVLPEVNTGTEAMEIGDDTLYERTNVNTRSARKRAQKRNNADNSEEDTQGIEEQVQNISLEENGEGTDEDTDFEDNDD